VIRIEADDVRQTAAWQILVALDDLHPRGWTLIGAQMVVLHAFRVGALPPRASLDADVLVDVRVLQDGTRRLAETLRDWGLELEGVSPDGIGHRFVGDRVVLDLLAPDGLGPRTRLLTVPPARTLQVPGGTQALRRTRRLEVEIEPTRGFIPLPSLLGAILLKSRAVSVDDVPTAQRVDLAFLLSLVDDPRTLATELVGSERQWLRQRREMLDPAHPAWMGIANADDARLALRLMADL
jgi:hypothetical protein